jgi:Tol biopolymer transport system component/DNA-binding winged helix-turn-helix (wHTH) protein
MPSCGHRVRFGDIVLDRRAFRVTRGGRDLGLEPKAVDVLCHLTERPGELVTKQELIAAVWKGTAVTDNALTRVIAQLRKALGDEARDARYIETIPTRGYRFIAALDDPDASVAQAVTGEPSPARAAGRGSRWVVPALMTATMLTVAALGVRPWLRSKPGPSEPVSDATSGAAQLSFSQALDVYQSFSPDGRLLAFSSSRTGTFQIFVTPLVPGGRDLQVTSGDGQYVQPAWSPDGRYVAYHSIARGGIWIVPATGGTARQIVDFGSAPAWSPDGTRLVFQSDALADLSPEAFGAVSPSTIWVASIDGRELRQLTRPDEPPSGHAAPIWAPDGRSIVFSARRYPTSGLWRIAVDGGTPTELKMPELGSWVSDPTYAPDGRSIVFSTIFELWRLPINPESGAVAGPPQRIAGPSVPAIRHPSFSPDGRTLAYGLVSMMSNLWGLRLTRATTASGAPFAVTSDTSRRNTLPAISPDGTMVAYQSTRSGAGIDVWVTHIDGSGARQVTTNPGFDGLPVWFANPARLRYLSARDHAVGVRETDLDTGHDRELFGRSVADRSLAAEASQMTPLSPDGLHLAFAAVRDGVSNIWILTFGTGEVRQLTFDREFAGWPNWSPDGRWIAYEIKRGDDTHVAVVSSSGGEPRPLTSGPGAYWPYGWSPDGTRIACAVLQRGVWNLWWISLQDGSRHQLTDYRSPSRYVRYPAWSPAGDLLVYESGEIRGNIWAVRLSE